MQRAIIVAERIAGEGIERAERLVHQHDARPCRQRPRNADALALAAGSSCGSRSRYCARSSRTRSSSSSTRAAISAGRRAEQFWRDADIAGDAQMRKQPAALEHIADPPPQPDRIDVAHVLALDRDGAAVGLDQPVGQPQQRGLARAGAADDGEEFALGDLERDVVDGLDAAASGRRRKRLADMRVSDRRGGSSMMRRVISSAYYSPRRIRSLERSSQGKIDLPRRGAALNLSFATAKASSRIWRERRWIRHSRRRSRLTTRRWRFGWPMTRVYTAVEQAQLVGRAWRIRRHRRPHRLREIDAAQRRRRAAQAGRGSGADLRPAADGPEPGCRLSVPGRCAVSLEDRDRQCRHRARDQGRAARAGAASARRAG